MTDTSSDWPLVDCVRAGDDRAFDALLDRHRRPILNFVYRMLGNAADAEDVAQTVFVRAYHAIREDRLPRRDAPFSAWLFQVARRASLDALRYRRRHPADFLDTDEDKGPAADSPTGRDAMAARETGTQVAAAIAKLPEDQRTAVILAEYEGLGYADIAAVLECSVKSVESRLYRARQFLRRHLAPLRE